jgi:hypothetical protein
MHLMKRLILAALAVLCAPLLAFGPANAATVAVTPANLAATKGASLPGDHLVFTGAFGDVTFQNVRYDPPITLDLAGATLGGIRVTDSAGIDIQGGDITADAWFGPAYVSGSQHVHLRGLTTHGDGKTNAVTLRSSQDVSLENSVLHSPRIGMTALDDVGLVARNNTVIGASKDGFDVSSSTDVVIEYNVCVGNVPMQGIHPDCAQFWNTAGFRVSDRIVVRYNTAYGDTQGFDTFGPTGSPPVQHLVLEHNQVFGTYPQGINVDGPGNLARWNAVHTLPGSKYKVSAHTGPGVTACGNTSDAALGKPATSDGACAAP